MDPIDQGHPRPQDEILKLRGYKTLPPAASAHPAEGRAEECAVRDMRRDADPAPGRSASEQPTKETHV